MSSRGGGGGRDRSRRDYPASGSSGRSNAPPSRHLWVGNLSHSIAEHELTDEFLRFGDLETVAFQPGRSYAFINFMIEDDAIAAMKALQGFPLAGNPLRIEFAKAEKLSAPSRDEDYFQRRDQHRSAVRGSSFSQKDVRARSASPETFYSDKVKMNDRSAEPSEVLWIGFPALLKVDEVILRKAFSPFGEIEKITVFPGRSYAFVRFRSIISACRAKETLQGKLFGNPRVHICFARNEAGSSNSGRGLANAPLSPNFKSNDRLGSSDNFLQDRNFANMIEDPIIRSPFLPNFDPGDPDVYSFNRKGTSSSGGNNTYEPWRLGEVEPNLQLQYDMYENHNSPLSLNDYPQKFPQKHSLYEEPWDLPEDTSQIHGAKKLKISSSLPEKELPEYPLSELERENHSFPRMFSDFPQHEDFDRKVGAGSFGYKQIPERPLRLAPSPGETSEHLKPSYDGFQVGSGLLPSKFVERKRFTPELDLPSLNEWKWEGTIAKGGTSVCRARCFPVGKVLDFMLPDFLDCTARTDLDRLAKYYHQASGAWVVFFVPESDVDMGSYNEFMHYLEEKQRVAVAKLDDRTTVFLVPPSDFSEKVLRVPGKLSISGVVLRLDHPASSFGSVHPNEKKEANLLSFQGDSLYAKPSMPSMAAYPELSKSGNSDISFLVNALTSAPPASFSWPALDIGNASDSYNEDRYEHPLHQRNTLIGPNQSPHYLQNSVSAARNILLQASSGAGDPTIQRHPSAMPRAMQETSSSGYSGGISGIPLIGNRKSDTSSIQETKPSVSLSTSIAALQPEQLAHLSSLLGQQRHASENFRKTNTLGQSDDFKRSQGYALQNNEVTSDISTSQFAQLQQLRQQQTLNLPTTMPPAAQSEVQPGPQRNHELLPAIGSQDADADPQKRLKATLDLAAALLQQIQQGKGP